MQIRGGNGGWLRVDIHDLPGPLYVRVGAELRVTELYIDGRGQELTQKLLRGLNLAPVEAFAVEVAATPAGAARMQLPGPDLSRLASHFSTGFGSQARHWVAESMRAQVDKSGVRQAPQAPNPRPAESVAAPRLSPPPDGRLTDEFLGQVANAYLAAIQRRMPPAQALADQAGVSHRTIHRWVYNARQRGILPAARRGRIV